MAATASKFKVGDRVRRVVTDSEFAPRNFTAGFETIVKKVAHNTVWDADDSAIAQKTSNSSRLLRQQ